jgi:hypothetical protein
MTDELDSVITELRQRHPGFPRDTVARLVCRTAEQLRDQPFHDRLAVVRHEAERQLAYAEQIPGA